MHIIRLIGGFAAISIVAGTLVFSLKSVPKAMNTAHRNQKPAAADIVPAPPPVASKDSQAGRDEEKKPAIAEETPPAKIAVAPAEPQTSSPAIHKCVENGKITYTSAACPATSTSVQTRIATSSP